MTKLKDALIIAGTITLIVGVIGILLFILPIGGYIIGGVIGAILGFILWFFITILIIGYLE